MVNYFYIMSLLVEFPSTRQPSALKKPVFRDFATRWQSVVLRRLCAVGPFLSLQLACFQGLSVALSGRESCVLVPCKPCFGAVKAALRPCGSTAMGGRKGRDGPAKASPTAAERAGWSCSEVLKSTHISLQNSFSSYLCTRRSHRRGGTPDDKWRTMEKEKEDRKAETARTERWTTPKERAYDAVGASFTACSNPYSN